MIGNNMQQSELESQILHYILTDTKYITTIFSHNNIPLEYFTNHHIRYVAESCANYNEEFSKVLSRDEFENILKNELNNKKIKEPVYHGAMKAYREAQRRIELQDDQFDRIFRDFKSKFIETKIRKIITDNKGLLDENRPYEYMEILKNSFSKYENQKEVVDGVAVLDAFRDYEKQIKDLVERRENPEAFVGIKTGIESLDKCFDGFEKGTLTLIGAMVSTGKSTFALNVSHNIAKTAKKKVLIISMEMPADQWMRKYNSLDFWIPYTVFKRGDKNQLPESKFKEVIEGIEKRAAEKAEDQDYKVLFIPSGTHSWGQIEDLMEKRLPTFKPDIIFIDQLSLIRLPGKEEKRHELGNTARDIRAYAQIQGIPIVLIVQANRASITKKGGVKQIEIDIDNIEESNQVGAHCDNFIALMAHKELFKIYVKIVKQRDGAKDTIELSCRHDYCAMYDVKGRKIYSDDGETLIGELPEGMDENFDIDDDIFEEDDTGIDSIRPPQESKEESKSTKAVEDESNDFDELDDFEEDFEEEDEVQSSIDQIMEKRNKAIDDIVLGDAGSSESNNKKKKLSYPKHLG